MGKLFDRLNNIDNDMDTIASYLKEKGFYESTMEPRFMNGFDYNKLTHGRPCLRHDSTIKDDYTLRIFINDIDIYYEVQNPWRSYETSFRYDTINYDTVETIDALLDEILEDVLY